MPRKPKQRQRRHDQDSPWKEILQHFLQPVLAFVCPRLHDVIDWSKGYEALDKEFQQIVADAEAGRSLADKLFRVWFLDGQEHWLLIHIEIQGQVDRDFGERMFRYNIRCFEFYNRRVLSMAILTDDNAKWRPRGFGYGGWISRTSFRFRSVKLLDYAGREAELSASANPVAQIVLAHLQARATRREPEDRRRVKIQLVKGLYERGWRAEDVRQLFRLIDWLMELPKELQENFRQELYTFEEERRMPYVTSIERMAREEGEQVGARNALLETIQTGLKDKFGPAGVRLMRKIRAIQELSQLHNLTRTLMRADSLEDVRALLE